MPRGLSLIKWQFLIRLAETRRALDMTWVTAYRTVPYKLPIGLLVQAAVSVWQLGCAQPIIRAIVWKLKWTCEVKVLSEGALRNEHLSPYSNEPLLIERLYLVEVQTLCHQSSAVITAPRAEIGWASSSRVVWRGWFVKLQKWMSRSIWITCHLFSRYTSWRN